MSNPAFRRKDSARHWRIIIICFSLAAAVWLVFGQTLSHGFVNFDDEVYVYQNRNITAGLTSKSAVWAFTHAHARNWHPLTTLSHMLDCQLYGLSPGGHHFTNVLLHGISAVLLFLLLRQMTGAVWRSAFVAALWAIHPLRVESVAWVAERKDVLSGLLFIVTLGAYVRYVRAPALRRYGLVVGCFAAGLLCKPMLVTLPLVCAALDYWPLRRFESANVTGGQACGRIPLSHRAEFRAALLDKIPLLVLSALSCMATLIAQGGPTGAIDPLPLLLRMKNAIVTVAIYLVQIVWPVNLAPFYPFPAGTLPAGQVIAAGVALVAITVAAIALRRRQPWLFVGWWWYLVMLLPVIGIVQIGMQTRADRYTYLPHIGVYIAGAWSVAEVELPAWFRRQLLPAVALTFLVLLTYLAWLQTQHWRDSRTLWTHTAAVTHENEVAEHNLGFVLQQEGQLDDAIAHYRRAIEIQSTRGAARYNLTVALAENNLANALYRKGDLEEAVTHYRAAVGLRPDYADGYHNLGTVLLQGGKVDAAIECFEKALALRPDDAGVHGRMGDALRQKRADAAALAHYESALQLEPAALSAHYSIAWLLATCPDASIRNGERALEITRRALQLPNGENALILRTLAAAYAAEGNFDEARAAAQRGVELATAERDRATLDSLRGDLELYRAKVPLRDVSPVR